jgi:hypothetical protein
VFDKIIAKKTLHNFYKNPKGTCLCSSTAENITPSKIKELTEYVSFWYINDNSLIKYYGDKVCINALITYPGIKSVNVILSDKTIIYNEVTQNELYDILLPFVVMV